VTFAEAVLGADIRCRPSTRRAGQGAAGTPSGRTLRVRGRGVKRADGKSGDLLVTVEVQVPSELSAAARRKLEEYAAVAPPAPRTRIDAVVAERDAAANGGSGATTGGGTEPGRRS
jgi:molecular chaperone DnaJ